MNENANPYSEPVEFRLKVLLFGQPLSLRLLFTVCDGQLQTLNQNLDVKHLITFAKTSMWIMD